MSENLNKLKAILREMFQLDQADLDFGIYRIMNQKRDDILHFLDRDLLPQVKTAFASFQGDDQQSIREEMEKLKKTLEDAGVPPETSSKYQALLAKLAQSVDVTALENDAFSQLTNFFRRYYQGGDFLSLRRYKAGVYAIPYEGEEVKLHWANADQYYIKSSENFRDYTFKLPSGKRAHFKLVDASTEQNNKKEQADKERRFILVDDTPLAVVNDELCIRFEYRAADEKSKQAALNEAAVQAVLAAASDDWKRELSALTPTEKNPLRTLLEKHLNDYTSKYSFDYFIHKDLGGFMRRELDFFIKNEVLFIDDLDADHVKASISKVKVIKEIGHKVIAFLEQLENFQKKLWLKKKFVVETGYCVTLDKVPEELYQAIITNTNQVEDWKRLFAIQDIVGDLHTPMYSDPLSVEFLKANPFLVLDTAFFDREFTEKLLATFDNLDDTFNGIIINSDNFQALNFLADSYKNQIKCIYIDPPYNTDSSEIIYKNGYKSSSWISLIDNPLIYTKSVLRNDGVLCATIDDEQQKELAAVIAQNFGKENMLGTVCIRINPSGRVTLKGLAQAHEYAIFAGKTDDASISKLPRTDIQLQRFNQSDDKGLFEWRNFRREGSSSERTARPRRYFPIYVDGQSIRIPSLEWLEQVKSYNILENPKQNEQAIYPVDSNGGERVWRWGIDRILSEITEIVPKINPQGDLQIYYKYRPNEEGVLPNTIWADKKYSATEYGTATLKNLFGSRNEFDFPKSIHAVEDCVKICLSSSKNEYVMDYFAGSGTTAHAVINLNREDAGKRKYILVEMGDHFDTALKPRIQKVIYSKDWKDGKPVSREGSSHMFKYIRLESYEDALNNLQLNRTPEQGSLLDQHDTLREQYMLSYMLDVESAGSTSLLNIAAFADPFGYRMNIARCNETRETVVDLLETFNWLLGIKVLRISQKEYRTAEFETDAEGRMQIKGRPRTSAAGEGWTFQEIEGMTLAGDKVLIIWRTLTKNPEQDNLMLDSWFSKRNYSTLDFEFARIYVNGDNNLENLKVGEERWKVALIEQEFKKLMFDQEGV